MHPLLFQIPKWIPLLGGMDIYTYGAIMALAFLAAFILLYHISSKLHDDTDFYMDLFVWIIIFGLLGAKLLYILVDWKEFLVHPLDMLNPRRGGLVWYGGVLAVLIMLRYYTRRRKKSFLHVADVLSSPMALGLAIGRWGCLMGGCCFGRPCSPDFPLAIVYPPGPLANEVAGIPVLPVPIFESVNVLILAGICYLIVTRGARQGITTYFCLTYYSLTRFLLEFLRGDIARGFLFHGQNFSLSTSQFISILIFFPALYLLIRTLSAPRPDSGAQRKSGAAAVRSKKKKT